MNRDDAMNEQTKIPVPKDGKPGEKSRAPSLIERATGKFDLGQKLAPPVPSAAALASRPPMAPPRAKQPAAAPVAARVAPIIVHVPVAAAAAVPVPEAAPAAPRRRRESDPAYRPTPKKPAKSYRIDRERLRQNALIVPEGAVTGLLEEFRIVKRQLLLSADESREGQGAEYGERILVCSAHPGEGKTYSAINLALSIAAEKDHEVLLVDADFAKPSILSTLGLPGQQGLMDALADPKLHVEDLIIGTDVPGLSILGAGSTSNADTEFLASSRTRQVLDRLTRDNPNRIVIFDSPPALAASPASELAMHVGQVLMVVRADTTSETALRDALSMLSGCENIQLLLNAVKFSPTGRRFGSYYGYGE